jgi:hypothetical protein
MASPGQLIAQGLGGIASRLDEQDKGVKRARATVKFLESLPPEFGVDIQSLAGAGADEVNSLAPLMFQGIQLGMQANQISQANRKLDIEQGKLDAEANINNSLNRGVGKLRKIQTELSKSKIPLAEKKQKLFEFFATDEDISNVPFTDRKGILSDSISSLEDPQATEKSQLDIESKKIANEKAQIELKQFNDEVKFGSKVDIKPQELRKEFNGLGQIKDLRTVQAAFNKVKRAGTGEQSPASDLSMVFNFMKVLDPGSVVREGEFKTAEQAKAWLEKSKEGGVDVPLTVENAINRKVEGLLLRPDQRADFVNQAEGAFLGQAETAIPAIGQFIELEKLRGFDEGIIITRADRDLFNKLSGSINPEQPTQIKQDKSSNIIEPKTIEDLSVGARIRLPSQSGDFIEGVVQPDGMTMKTDDGKLIPIVNQ